MAAVVFQNTISPAAASGVVLIIAGSVAYAIASARSREVPRSLEDGVPPAQARQAEVDALIVADGSADGSLSEGEGHSKSPKSARPGW